MNKTPKISIKRDSILKQINDNFPLLTITRIQYWSVSFTINFSGIKKANLLWKVRVDNIVNILKNEITEELNKSIGEDWMNFRIIVDRYNRLLLNICRIQKDFFEIDKEEIKDDIIKKYQLNKKEKEILKILDFSFIRYSNKRDGMRWKMLNYYESIFNARLNDNDFKNNNNILFSNLEDKNTLIKKAILLARRIKIIEGDINDWYDFWTNLEKVKKWIKINDSKKELLYKRYKAIIDVFDIVMPFVGELNFDILEKETKENEGKIQKMIDVEEYNNEELIKYNYKWELTKKEFLNQCVWRKGIMFFFDFIGMWIDNIQDNRRNIINFLLDENNSEEDKENKLLEAWLNTTNNFLEIKDELKKVSWENVKITIIWDEIYMFVEWNNNIENLKKDFTNIFSKNNKKSRISYTNITEWNNNLESLDKIYADLDTVTDKVNKNSENNTISKNFVNLEIVQELNENKKEIYTSFYELKSIPNIVNCVLSEVSWIFSNNWKQLDLV